MNEGVTPTTGSVDKLIQELNKLPGIGPKSAQRLAYHILRVPEEQTSQLAAAIISVKQETRLCSICFTFTDADNDRMDDAWEEENGLDPAMHDSQDDPDGDSLSNLDEYFAGTSPQNATSSLTDSELVNLVQGKSALFFIEAFIPAIEVSKFFSNSSSLFKPSSANPLIKSCA